MSGDRAEANPRNFVVLVVGVVAAFLVLGHLNERSDAEHKRETDRILSDHQRNLDQLGQDEMDRIVSDYEDSLTPPRPVLTAVPPVPVYVPRPDVDCSSGNGNGPDYQYGSSYVGSDDPYGLDGDGDGVACEGG